MTKMTTKNDLHRQLLLTQCTVIGTAIGWGIASGAILPWVVAFMEFIALLWNIWNWKDLP